MEGCVRVRPRWGRIARTQAVIRNMRSLQARQKKIRKPKMANSTDRI